MIFNLSMRRSETLRIEREYLQAKVYTKLHLSMRYLYIAVDIFINKDYRIKIIYFYGEP